MTRKDEVGVDIQTHTETISQPSNTNSLEAILQRLDAEMEVTIEDRGKTLTLGDVKWSESADVDGEGNPVTRYTATASYTGTASSRYATGYTVSASYTSEVSKASVVFKSFS